MSGIPAMRKVMVGHPYTTKSNDTASAAEKFMNAHRIRHLPVLDGDRVIGIISDRDLMLGRTMFKNQKFDGKVLVNEVCRLEECTVDIDEPIDKVALMMSKRKLDAVVVVQGGKAVGIFTSTDACRLLADLCQTKAHDKGFWSKLLG